MGGVSPSPEGWWRCLPWGYGFKSCKVQLALNYSKHKDKELWAADFFYKTLLQPCKLDYHCNRTKTLGCISGTKLNYLARSNTDANANELIWACSLNWNDEPFPHSVFLRYLLSSRQMIWWCYRKQNTAFILCNGRLASCNSKICFVLICYNHNTFIANV